MNDMTTRLKTPVSPGHDANLRQNLASDPSTSVWVSASAGTGKTKILTDRVLRLMLPRPGEDTDSASMPDKILCLTYTKNAASEMADRIHSRLSTWSVMDDAALAKNLEELFQASPDEKTMAAARALFARVVDISGGMKIMTIHSFCQSVLKRFPLEAGLPPHFELLDDRTSNEYMARAQRRIIANVNSDPETILAKAFRAISAEVDGKQFGEVMKSLNSDRQKLRALFKHYPDHAALKAALFGQAGLSPDDRIEDFKSPPAPDQEKLMKAAIPELLQSTVNNIKLGVCLQTYFETPPERRHSRFNEYCLGFLTTEGAVRVKVATSKFITANPHLEDVFSREAERIYALCEKIKTFNLAQNTYNLLIVGSEILKIYERIKSDNSQLDYDDLIDHTEALLSDAQRAIWVLYKMDQGVDHILVDEAQDTSPRQWRVIRSLIDEFFNGESARADTHRTLFVVGDEKQSIFSFQGADPLAFKTMRLYFKEKIETAQKKFKSVDLLQSFRSTAAVLYSVDHIFSAPETARGVQGDLTTPMRHEAFREGHAGHVELWPLIESEKTDPPAPWTPPIEVIRADNAHVRLADKIAETIAGWLDRGEVLESKGRPIRAGDIMILFKARTNIDHILRALKERHIPISGVDRMILTDHLAVQDCLMAAQVALLSEDDLGLATFLKSPFIGYDEARLYALAQGRSGRLWPRLKHYDSKAHYYIKALRNMAQSLPPYDFFERLLVEPCPGDTAGGRRALYGRLGLEIDDALDELLNAALDFEHLHGPAMQNFLFWFSQGKVEIKREQEGGHANQVRLMTVHASKGLQAPIIFLPDTASIGNNAEKLLWPESRQGDKGGILPLWAARQTAHDTQYETYFADVKLKDEEEYRRLLYVALTRAEDRLYICGAKPQKTDHSESWYKICHGMLTSMGEIKKIPFEVGHMPAGEALVYKTAQTAKPADKSDKTDRIRTIARPAPDWLNRPPPEEPNPPKPLAPSRPSESEPAIRSPLVVEDKARFARGNLVHQLLEYLPELPPDRRDAACRSFLARPCYRLPNAEQNALADEILKILTDPAFASLFGAQSRAEVPIIGRIDKWLTENYYAVSGQIDRMVVEEDRVLIVDYKTNRPPPSSEEDVPAVYWRQMAAYQTVLEQVYPGKRVECALLWTDAPRLMPLSDEKLKRFRKV